jgi:hypothetical protein
MKQDYGGTVSLIRPGDAGSVEGLEGMQRFSPLLHSAMGSGEIRSMTDVTNLR